MYIKNMVNSNSKGIKKPSWRIAFLLAIVIIVVELLIIVWNWQKRQTIIGMQFDLSLTPNTVIYRYRFGGEIITHYLNDVVKLTKYRHGDVVDQVVLILKNDDFYVLNTDMLVEYQLSPQNLIQKDEILNVLFNHYDPYLQGEKQDMHRLWVTEQYQKYVGRNPTDQEWLEALNELTRGVEHHQMERWIQYSPSAIQYWIDTRLSDMLGRQPRDEEIQYIGKLLMTGVTYAQIESKIAPKTAKK